MKYYRLVLKKDNNGISASEIVEQFVDAEMFQNMAWDKPIIYHKTDGMYHFIALDKSYLEAFLGGMETYIEIVNERV